MAQRPQTNMSNEGWTCERCTLINQQSYSACELCLHPKGREKRTIQEQILKDEELARRLQEIYAAERRAPLGSPSRRSSQTPHESRKRKRESSAPTTPIPRKRRRVDAVNSPGMDENIAQAPVEREDSATVVKTLLSGLKLHDETKEIDQLPELTVQLMPHQRRGVAWAINMEKNRLRQGGILCDDMGLGKTIQMLALCIKTRQTKTQRTLVVAPLCVLEQWKQEAERLAPGQFTTFMYHNTDANKVRRGKVSLSPYNLVLTTYGTVGADIDKKNGLFTQKRNFFYRIILDEGHRISNRRAKQSKACWKLGERCTYRWILTGTPIQNNLVDIFSLGKFLQLEECKVYTHFQRRYLSAYNRRASEKRLHALFSSISLRRTKSEIEHEFPPRTDRAIEGEFSEVEAEIYKAFETKAVDKLQRLLNNGVANKSYATIFGLVTKLRLACDHIYLAIGKNVHEKIVRTEEDEKEKEKEDEKESPSDSDPNCVDPLADIDDEVIRRLNDEDSALLDECNICYEEMNESGVLLRECGHSFCKEHLDELMECPFRCGPFNLAAAIPLTEVVKSKRLTERAKLSPDDQIIFDQREAAEMERRLAEEARQKQMEEAKESDEVPETDVFVSSAKVDLLCERLKLIRQEDPMLKTLVFTSFVKMIEICDEKLNRDGFNTLRYTGGMTRKAREKVLCQLREDNDVTVMLMSLKCANVGLNLTCASRVIFVDVWWNPSVEQQAIDRVHRIGQTRPVIVERLTIANTVEQRILRMQRRKKELAAAVLDGARTVSKQKLGVSELRQLFGV